MRSAALKRPPPSSTSTSSSKSPPRGPRPSSGRSRASHIALVSPSNTLTALTGGTPANPTTLSIESKLVPTVQLGATVALNDRWFVDAMVAKTWLKTRTTLSTGQTLDIRLNPTTVAIAVGYRY